jgi:putative membrane protein
MFTTASTPTRHLFRDNVVLQGLLGGYVVFWAAMGLMPTNPSAWLLLNLLPVLFVAALALTHRRYPLSDMAYLCIAVFLTLHAIGSHYAYAKVPAGFWLQQLLNVERNHFDRLVHFGFGFLMVYPLREVLIRSAKLGGFWAYSLAVSVVMAGAGLWEVAESWVAQTVRPELGAAFLGSQGDIWDAQKDIVAAFYGSLLCTSLVVLARHLLSEETEDETEESEEPELEAALGE